MTRSSILTQSDEAAGSCQARVVYQSIGDIQFIQQQYSLSEMKNACFRAKPGLVNGTASGFWFALLIAVSSMRDHACLGALPIHLALRCSALTQTRRTRRPESSDNWRTAPIGSGSHRYWYVRMWHAHAHWHGPWLNLLIGSNAAFRLLSPFRKSPSSINQACKNTL
jgi:hypothetical protein